ncbi:CAAX amino terminal protease self- immunity [Mycolicibacterium tokaiense]|uniref:CAAX amino terminal protease self- immunity n=1 Tax=Mycolicibacterium tokaiense TaxID=39695 RepID=A0A378T737_9MYCO|nr:CAAX amino terminal protease self- immunity [Mycolicibacterium tokaiense]
MTPTEAVEFHRVLATDHRRIGRGILAIVLLIGGLQVFAVALTTGAAFLDAVSGNTARGGFTPLTYGAGMLSVALLLPWSRLIQRWLYGLPGGSLSSVTSRFRWDVLGRSLILVGPAWVIILIVQYWVPLPQTSWGYHDVIGLLVITLLIAPLQAAGEEYGFRGLIFQVAGSWSVGRRAGLVLAIAVSSVLFAAIHVSTSGWLNLWYVVFAVGTGVISWRTGGIEIAVVLHAVYNTLSFVFDAALHIDPIATTNRSGSAVGIEALLPGIVIVAVTIVVFLVTRSSGPVVTPADPVDQRHEGVSVA